MERFLRKMKANAVVSSLLCVVLGLVLVIWPGMSMQIVCAAIGVLLILTGLMTVIAHFDVKDGRM